MAIEVAYYGVHWAPGDVAFLHQARGGANAMGAAISSPFAVRMRRKWQVNHLFGLNAINPARAHLDALRTIIERNSLARFMLPIPKKEDAGGIGVLYNNSPDTPIWLTCLLKMSSPIRLPVQWARLANPKTVMDDLEMTNVQPLVLLGVGPDQIQWVRDVMRAATQAPRKLLVVADPKVPFNLDEMVEGTEIISRNLIDLTALPWETFGNIILRAYMRNEWDGMWFTREPTPGNETKDRKVYD